MKKIFILTILCGFLNGGFIITPAIANHEPGGKHAVIKVKGMVCDFCARTVEKVFGEQEEVAAIRVDLDVQQVELDLKKDADLTDEAITKHIIDAGLNVVEIKRH